MTFSPENSASAPPPRNRWLLLIALFKLIQGVFFTAVGFGVLHFLHKDVGDELAQIADHLRFNPESRFVNFVLDRASLLDDHLLRRIGAVVFIYAGVDLIEGVGLYLEKVWAEFLTLLITASFLPWELFQILKRFTVSRVSLLVVNAIVFLYLLKLVSERIHRHAASEGREEAGACENDS